jgi:sigma-B regulation protein RsbU (phosphoserine phosphatase)
VSWSLDPTPGAPGRVRRWVRTILTSWNIATDRAEDVVLVLNELVANVVDHAATRMTVTIDRAPGVVSIAVSDAGDGQPRLQPLNSQAKRGRGLQLVDALCVRWGTVPRLPGPGKLVWAHIACGAAPGSQAG